MELFHEKINLLSRLHFFFQTTFSPSLCHIVCCRSGLASVHVHASTWVRLPHAPSFSCSVKKNKKSPTCIPRQKLWAAHFSLFSLPFNSVGSLITVWLESMGIIQLLSSHLQTEEHLGEKRRKVCTTSHLKKRGVDIFWKEAQLIKRFAEDAFVERLDSCRYVSASLQQYSVRHLEKTEILSTYSTGKGALTYLRVARLLQTFHRQQWVLTGRKRELKSTQTPGST